MKGASYNANACSSSAAKFHRTCGVRDTLKANSPHFEVAGDAGDQRRVRGAEAAQAGDLPMSDEQEQPERHFPTIFVGGSLNTKVMTVREGRHWWEHGVERYYKVTQPAQNGELVPVFVLHGLDPRETSLLIAGACELMTARKVL